MPIPGSYRLAAANTAGNRFLSKRLYGKCIKIDWNLPKEKLINKLIQAFQYIEKPDLYLNKILNIEIPYLFSNKLEEYNAIFGQQQIENISNTIMLVECHKAERLENIKKNINIKNVPNQYTF